MRICQRAYLRYKSTCIIEPRFIYGIVAMHAFQPSGFPVHCSPASCDQSRLRILWLLSNSPVNRRLLYALLAIVSTLALLKIDAHLASLQEFLRHRPDQQLIAVYCGLELIAAALWLLIDAAFPGYTVVRITVSVAAVMLFTLLYDTAAAAIRFGDFETLCFTVACRCFLPRADHVIRTFSFAYARHVTMLVALTQLLPHVVVSLVHSQLPTNSTLDHARFLFLVCLVPVVLTLFWPSSSLVYDIRQIPRPSEDDDDDDEITAKWTHAIACLDDRSRKLFERAWSDELILLQDNEHRLRQQQQQRISHSKPNNGYTLAVKLLTTALFFDRPLTIAVAIVWLPRFDLRRDTVPLHLGAAFVAVSCCFVYQLALRHLEQRSSSVAVHRLRVASSLVGVFGLLANKLMLLWMQTHSMPVDQAMAVNFCVVAVTLGGFAELARTGLLELSNAEYLREAGRSLARWVAQQSSNDSTPLPSYREVITESQQQQQQQPQRRKLFYAWSLNLVRLYNPTIISTLLFIAWLAAVGDDGAPWLLSLLILLPTLLLFPTIVYKARMFEQ